MVKTKNQLLHTTIKKEECEDKPKLVELLRKTKTKKYRLSKTRVVISPRFPLVKSENADDDKKKIALLLSSSSSSSSSPSPLTPSNAKRVVITSEQITKLIGYIVNDKMVVEAAGRKAGMSPSAAYVYYNDYKNDPEHKIPVPKTIAARNQDQIVTQEKIKKLIEYVVKDKMLVYQAAAKAHIHATTAFRYYKKYLKDPDHKIPTIYKRARNLSQRYTEEQVNELVGYIVNDHMTVEEAAKKLNMSKYTAEIKYLKFLQSQNRENPAPKGYDNRLGIKSCTNNQVKVLIDCIVNKGMDYPEASVKANMSLATARKYHKQYVQDPDHKIPTPEDDISTGYQKGCTLDKVKAFFRYIIVDQLPVRQAAHKAELAASSAYSYYKRYLKKSTLANNNIDNSYSVQKMKKMLEYKQNLNISITAAARKANLDPSTAGRYYRMYLSDPQRRIPQGQRKRFTQEDVKKLIGYIENDKMTIFNAARKAKMSYDTGNRYYRAYKNDPEHKIPPPGVKGQKLRCKVSDKYSQIIADIKTETQKT